MKANELRIGNLVWEDYSGEMIVFGLVECGINPRVELRKKPNLPAGSYSVDKIQPIPLTEEWLLKFGFNVEAEFNSKDYWYHDKMRTFKGSRFYIYLPYGIYDGMAPCKYVHQLQNLYFALTGSEL